LPATLFTESSAGGALSACAAATSVGLDVAICKGHCEDGYAACLDNCVADFGSCPVDTPRLNCIQAYRACTKSCQDERAQCLARCG
jgi:hypothetical protein